MFKTPTLRSNRLVAAAGVAVPLAIASPAVAAPVIPTAPTGFTVSQFATAPSGAATGADDIAGLGRDVFVGWQNGVGPKGEPSPTGTTSSTLVEYGPDGQQLASWNLRGKIDGIAGDPAGRRLIATANEDGNSSLYTISMAGPSAARVTHYTYSPAPDAASTGGVATGGGTDAVAVDHGVIVTSASNPGAPNATAAFIVSLNPRTRIARLSPTFADNAQATDAQTGKPVTLALTDPDSNAVVPQTSPRFAGEFALDSQGDQELVFAKPSQSGGLTRLAMTHGGTSAGVDDVRWAAGNGGTLYVVDHGANVVYKVTGPFQAGQAFASLDTVGTASNNTEVDTLNLTTGALSPFLTGLNTAKGLLWVPPSG